MSKYYLITVSTPYCGEIEYHTLCVADDEDIYDTKYLNLIDEWMCENASEWWEEDDDCYEGDFDAYLGDCSWEYSVIPKEEYERMAKFY